MLQIFAGHSGIQSTRLPGQKMRAVRCRMWSWRLPRDRWQSYSPLSMRTLAALLLPAPDRTETEEARWQRRILRMSERTGIDSTGCPAHSLAPPTPAASQRLTQVLHKRSNDARPAQARPLVD